MKNNIFKDWLSVSTLSSYLNISKETVYRMVKKDTIPYHRLGKLLRFRKDEIDKWLSKN